MNCLHLIGNMRNNEMKRFQTERYKQKQQNRILIRLRLRTVAMARRK